MNLIPQLDQVAIIIPTFRAERYLEALIDGLSKQNISPQQVLVIDSTSNDGTVERLTDYGARVHSIPQAEFNHGGTRRLATILSVPAPFLIFMTQDAIPDEPGAFEKLLHAFADPSVGMTYGRQKSRPQAMAIERHARLYNYPDNGTQVRNLASRAQLGIKTTFCSNSFAAYRRTALEQVGGFPEDAFFAEDQITAGKMLSAGWSLAYAAEASVTHSHGYSLAEEFRRYFDVGVFHARSPWLLQTFGRAEGEGLRFVKSELRYLFRHEPWSIPASFARTVAKYVGYSLGSQEARLSTQTKIALSMSPAYWRARLKK